MRALIATLTFSAALGISNAVKGVAIDAFGWSTLAASFLQAGLCSALTLIGILTLARRGGISNEWFGLTRRNVTRDLSLGWAVPTAAALLVIVPVALAGGFIFESVDLQRLVPWLATSLIIATGLEAFPEELTFRGMAYSSLGQRFRRTLAAAITTVLFVASVGVGISLSSVISTVLGANPNGPTYSIAPAGQDPITYVALLILWSVMLIQARQVTGSIWVPVAAHLVLLIINRILIWPEASGSGISLAHPDVVLVVPAYIVVATVGFRLLRHRLGSQETK